MRPLTVLTTLLSTSLPFGALCAPSQQCKPLPGTPHWPSQEAWAQLNDTIDGHLVSPAPPGAVCHPTHELYNNASCTQLQKDWMSSAWHSANPITSDYNDDTCMPDPNYPCTRDGYPAFTVNATEHTHVAAAVKFAAETGVRLVIKGTGHDFPGRSAGRGSLSIHTHYLRGITVQHSEPRALKYGGSASVKIAAGMRMGELYEQMSKENLTISAGADLNVGIGGWTGGGGHSPVSSLYGLGSDNVLEMEVVTTDGEIRTINEDSDADLFWAMRGGGPSTYAVLLSVTMMAYPSINLTNYVFFYNTTALSPSFWNMTALFHSHLPRISESGGMGYYFTLPNISTLAGVDPNSGLVLPFDVSVVPPSQLGLILGTFLFNSTPEAATEAMAPLESALRDLSTTDPTFDPIQAAGFAVPPAGAFSTVWVNSTPQSVGSKGRLGSWLLGSEALSRPLPDLAAAFAAASEDGATPQLGHVVAGPGVHRFGLSATDSSQHRALPGGSNAVNPAWRTAYTHVVLPAGWGPGVEAKSAATAALQKRVNALRELEPASGAYMNEADPTNPEWKEDYFGRQDCPSQDQGQDQPGGKGNYEKLLAIKNKWDGQGVFWCRSCVGSDAWEWVDADGVQDGQGVGQDVGLLCRKKE